MVLQEYTRGSRISSVSGPAWDENQGITYGDVEVLREAKAEQQNKDGVDINEMVQLTKRR